MIELSRKLLAVIDAAEGPLAALSESESESPALPGGWSSKQLLGHLIDSASNNHQRFVRALQAESLDFPAYNQAANVEVQAIQQANWQLLVRLWASYNRFLAHVVAQIPGSKLSAPCRIGSDDPVTLGYLAEDYLTHLLHHLRQIGLP